MMVVQEVLIDHIISLEARTTCPNRETESKRNGIITGAGGETMIRLAVHAATNNNNSFCCECTYIYTMLVASATEPTGPRRSIVFAYGRNRCRLFRHRMDAYALFTLSIHEDEILDADRRNRLFVIN